MLNVENVLYWLSSLETQTADLKNSNSSNWPGGLKQIKSILENPPETKIGLLDPESGRETQATRENQIAKCNMTELMINKQALFCKLSNAKQSTAGMSRSGLQRTSLTMLITILWAEASPLLVHKFFSRIILLLTPRQSWGPSSCCALLSLLITPYYLILQVSKQQDFLEIAASPKVK